MMKAAALALAFAGTAVQAIHLDPTNYDTETAGKSVFLKFYAPWCGHCKSLKPAWDQLIGEFESSKTAGVYDVDCTAAGKPLCDSNGVRGFPTIKYGSPSALEDYEGGRDFDSLKKFADENLGPSCGPDTLDLCSAEQKAELEKVMAFSSDEITTKVAAAEKELEDAEATFKSEVEKLQATYEKLSKTKDETIAEVKKGGLSLLKQVAASRKAGKQEL